MGSVRGFKYCIKGLNLDALWDGFNEQVALNSECVSSCSEIGIAERIARQEEIRSYKKKFIDWNGLQEWKSNRKRSLKS